MVNKPQSNASSTKQHVILNTALTGKKSPILRPTGSLRVEGMTAGPGLSLDVGTLRLAGGTRDAATTETGRWGAEVTTVGSTLTTGVEDALGAIS